MSIQSLARSLNLETSGSSIYGPNAFGVVDGYRISLSVDAQNTGFLVYLSVVMKETLSSETLAVLTASAKQLRRKIQADGKTVRLILAGGGLLYSSDKKVTALIHNWLGILRVNGIIQSDDCVLCDEPGNDRNVFLRGVAVPVHQACYEKLVGEYRSRYQTVETSTQNLAKGYLMAVLGMALGALVNFIVLMFGYLFAILFALIPFFAFVFYNKSGAPKQKKVPLILGGLSLVVGVGLMVVFYVLLANLLELGSLAEYLAVEENLTGFYSDMGMAVLFSLLGVVVSWNYMRKHSNLGAEKELKDMESKI